MYQEAHLRFSKQELVRHGTSYHLSGCVFSANRGGSVVIKAILSPLYVRYLRPDHANLNTTL